MKEERDKNNIPAIRFRSKNTGTLTAKLKVMKNPKVEASPIFTPILDRYTAQFLTANYLHSDKTRRSALPIWIDVLLVLSGFRTCMLLRGEDFRFVENYEDTLCAILSYSSYEYSGEIKPLSLVYKQADIGAIITTWDNYCNAGIGEKIDLYILTEKSNRPMASLLAGLLSMPTVNSYGTTMIPNQAMISLRNASSRYHCPMMEMPYTSVHDLELACDCYKSMKDTIHSLYPSISKMLVFSRNTMGDINFLAYSHNTEFVPTLCARTDTAYKLRNYNNVIVWNIILNMEADKKMRREKRETNNGSDK